MVKFKVHILDTPLIYGSTLPVSKMIPLLWTYSVMPLSAYKPLVVEFL